MDEEASNRSEEFCERLLGVLNAGALALMTAIGHRTGLFDTMAGLPAMTSAQIAAAGGLDERYVREWLAVMTTGGFLEHDPVALTYLLPAGHARWLTRSAGPDNLALQSQYIGLLAGVEDQIVHCFQHGGGVPYSQLPRFAELMAEESGGVHDASRMALRRPAPAGLTNHRRIASSLRRRPGPAHRT